MSTIESIWAERGDSAAREDIRAGHTGAWDEGAVLAHLGIFTEEDALGEGVEPADLAMAQRSAIAGYARVMAERGI